MKARYYHSLLYLYYQQKKKRKNPVSYRIINIRKVHTRTVSTPESAMFSSPGSIFSNTLIICVLETVPSKLIVALYRKV